MPPGTAHAVSEVRERAAGRRAGPEPPAPEVELDLPGASFADVGRLVLAGMASRSGLTIERIDELQLALDTILRRGVAPDTVAVRMRPEPEALGVRIGPLLLGADERAELERVLAVLVDDVSMHETGGDAWIDLRVRHAVPTAS